jgi:hypothetical protein
MKMSKHVGKGVSFLAMVVALSAPVVAVAGEWVVREDPMGPGYIVTDDEIGTIHTKGKKAADKIAKTLNKAESDGFVDNGEGPCGHPSSRVLC